METPSVETKLVIKNLNFIFVVRAYRRLSREEMEEQYAYWRTTARKNRPVKNGSVVLLTTIGP
jgi:hypothetical protein